MTQANQQQEETATTSPPKVKITRHMVKIRAKVYSAFTIPADGFERLVALMHDDGTIWQHRRVLRS